MPIGTIISAVRAGVIIATEAAGAIKDGVKKAGMDEAERKDYLEKKRQEERNQAFGCLIAVLLVLCGFVALLSVLFK